MNNYYANDDNPLESLELKTRSLTPPLDLVQNKQQHTCLYLLNLFLAPNIKRYLKETPFSDDIYTLPIHFQKIITEARMEAIMANTNNGAMERLERLRVYINTIALGDTAVVIDTLNELIADEDELSTILGE